MNQGYVALYRKTLESRVFQNEGLLKVWIWCLLKANHRGQWVTIKSGRGTTGVWVEAGSFVFGRHSAAKELKMSPSTIWKRIKKLEEMRNCDIKSNSKYSIIIIVNWHIYQAMKEIGDSQGTAKVTAQTQSGSGPEAIREQRKEHKQELYSLSQRMKKEDPLRGSDPLRGQIQNLCDYFSKSFEHQFDVPYITVPKDRAYLSELLNIHTAEVLEQMIDRFFQDPDPYFEKVGRSISVFMSQINKYGSTETSELERLIRDFNRRKAEEAESDG